MLSIVHFTPKIALNNFLKTFLENNFTNSKYALKLTKWLKNAVEIKIFQKLQINSLLNYIYYTQRIM